jgi:hypothetical protein
LRAGGRDHPAAELGDDGRLDEHVVRAGVEALHARLFIILAAEHRDPHRRTV